MHTTERVAMTQTQRLVPSNSNVLVELKRVAAHLDRTPHDSADRMVLLRRQAALGDLRDDIEQRARRRAAR
jgi:hypothetical protein